MSTIPLIFGEVLFDCFEPDGPDVLGGAPFNVAWHLQGFGLQPLLISAIGADERGEQVLSRMKTWGMATDGIQQLNQYATGMVRIRMEGSSHTFDILPDQAYDHIGETFAVSVLEQHTPSLLYCGSLVGRSQDSAQTLQSLVASGLPLFVDINLRSPWWQKEAVLGLMHSARWLKLNDDEFTELTGKPIAAADIRELQETLGNEWLILTEGDAGANIQTRHRLYQDVPPKIEQLVDTVGAGDAFSAVVLLGIAHEWSPEVILRRALEFAARICEQQGATAMNHALYQQYREAWHC